MPEWLARVIPRTYLAAMSAPVLAYENLGLVQGAGWLFRGLDIFIGARGSTGTVLLIAGGVVLVVVVLAAVASAMPQAGPPEGAFD